MMLGLAAAMGLVFAVVFWFVAQNVWLSLGLFAGIFALAAVTGWLVTWRPSPSVTCHGCGGRGWIDDLTETGACPACGGVEFRFYRFQGEQQSVLEERIGGAELRERRKGGMPWV